MVCLACYLVASGGQSGWLLGWAAVKAGWCSKWRSTLRIVGKGLRSTWNLRALNICGTRQQSANVISSPTQYLPALDDNSFSTAESKNGLISICAGLCAREGLVAAWIKRWFSECCFPEHIEGRHTACRDDLNMQRAIIIAYVRTWRIFKSRARAHKVTRLMAQLIFAVARQ